MPPQTGPGHPRRFCSEDCRRAARRDARSGSPQRIRCSLPNTAFGERLGVGIRDSGLSLEAICAKATVEDGVDLSPSTVSNWSHGRTPRPSPERDNRVHALERILGMSRGELLLLLTASRPAAPLEPRPTGGPPAAPHQQLLALRDRVGRLGGVDGYVTTSVKERYVIGRDRQPRYRMVEQTIRATDDHTDCYWLFASADDRDAQITLRTVPPCRVGRRIQHGSLMAAELLFDKTLTRGDVHTFAFRLDSVELPHPPAFVRRWTSPPGQPALDALQMEVKFEARPRAVWECEWPTEYARPVDLLAVRLDAGVARLTRTHAAPSLIGVRWNGEPPTHPPVEQGRPDRGARAAGNPHAQHAGDGGLPRHRPHRAGLPHRRLRRRSRPAGARLRRLRPRHRRCHPPRRARPRRRTRQLPQRRHHRSGRSATEPGAAADPAVPRGPRPPTREEQQMRTLRTVPTADPIVRPPLGFDVYRRMAFGQALEARRRQCGLTQSLAAALTGRSVGDIIGLENSTITPTVDVVFTLAEDAMLEDWSSRRGSRSSRRTG